MNYNGGITKGSADQRYCKKENALIKATLTGVPKSATEGTPVRYVIDKYNPNLTYEFKSSWNEEPTHTAGTGNINLPTTAGANTKHTLSARVKKEGITGEWNHYNILVYETGINGNGLLYENDDLNLFVDQGDNKYLAPNSIFGDFTSILPKITTNKIPYSYENKIFKTLKTLKKDDELIIKDNGGNLHSKKIDVDTRISFTDLEKVGNWRVTDYTIDSLNGAHSFAAWCYTDFTDYGAIEVISGNRLNLYNEFCCGAIVDNSTVTHRNYYNQSDDFYGVYAILAKCRNTSYSYSSHYDNFSVQDVIVSVGNELSLNAYIINDSKFISSSKNSTNELNPYYTYWANKGYFQRARHKGNNQYYWIPTQKGADEFAHIKIDNLITNKVNFKIAFKKVSNKISIYINNVLKSTLEMGGTRSFNKFGFADADYDSSPSYKNLTTQITTLDLQNLNIVNIENCVLNREFYSKTNNDNDYIKHNITNLIHDNDNVIIEYEKRLKSATDIKAKINTDNFNNIKRIVVELENGS